MKCFALVLLFFCLVCAHLCGRMSRKERFRKRLTPPRPLAFNRLLQVKPFRSSELTINRQGLRKFAQDALQKEAGTKARVDDAAAGAKKLLAVAAAAGLAGGVVAGGAFASNDWDLDKLGRAIQNTTMVAAGFGTSGTKASHHKSPLVTISSMDSRQLLQSWSDSSKAPDAFYEIYDNAKVCRIVRDVVAQSTNNFVRLWDELEEKHSEKKTGCPLRHLFDDQLPARMAYGPNHYNNRWLRPDHEKSHQPSMLGQLAQLASYATGGLEMVGMIPKASVESGSPAVASESWGALDAPVQALGVFSRETVEDDRTGTLCREIEEHYGKQFSRRWWGSPRKEFDVFAMEGISDVPDFSKTSARVLMSKIAQYALDEQKVVVVPERAFQTRHGPELLHYYERLGFKRVLLEGALVGRPGSQVLLYVGDALIIDKVGNQALRDMKMAEDKTVDDQQMMIGMNLWSDLEARQFLALQSSLQG